MALLVCCISYCTTVCIARDYGVARNLGVGYSHHGGSDGCGMAHKAYCLPGVEVCIL